MMSMRDRHERDGEITTKFPIGHADGDPPSPPPRSDMPNIDRSDQKLTLGSTTLTWDQQTAADGEGGTPRSCTKHATARLHTRIRQRSTKSCNNYEPMVYLVVFLHWQATHRHRVLLTTIAEHATHGRHCVQRQLVGCCTQAGFCNPHHLFIGVVVPSWDRIRPTPLQQKVELRKPTKN